MEYLPYTYLIGWITVDKWYYGVEYGLKKHPPANPLNLWKTYFTSSNIVSHFRKKYGEPQVIEVQKIFSEGTDEEKMIASLEHEKNVLTKIDITNKRWLNGRIGGDICPANNKKISLLRYGVENVFAADEIKEKIKQRLMGKYGVDHPSKSIEVINLKKDNNLKKYGVTCTLQLPGVREKCNIAIRSDEVKNSRKQTNLLKYGVENVAQSKEVMDKMLSTKNELSNRQVVKHIREYKRVFKFSLYGGWYQQAEDVLFKKLDELKNSHGSYTYEELTAMQYIPKYSDSIKKLQNRPLVKKIKKYKEKYGNKIKCGKCWDRKCEADLIKILSDLEYKYGKLD